MCREHPIGWVLGEKAGLVSKAKFNSKSEVGPRASQKYLLCDFLLFFFFFLTVLYFLQELTEHLKDGLGVLLK